MPLLTIENLPGPPIVVPAGATLLAAVQRAGHDWHHACGAKGRCTTCRVQLVAGAENLTPLTEPELRYRAAGRLLPTERLTCQARLPEADAVGRVPEGAKLPHVEYLG
ncbi:MAG: 2Fe-2S iron-sulfur cluster-binding protein [Janthinobacterium lividum]